MTLGPSRRSERIAPFIVMDVLRAANERAAEGKDVLHLEVGQPGLGAPGAVVEAARAAMASDKLGYTEAFGVPALRARIARHYRDAYGIAVPVERIVVTTGSSGAFLLAFLAAFDEGDRVAMAAPGYPAYRNILAALGVEVVEIPTGAATRYQPTPALLDALEKPVKGLVVASPSNPSGTMLGEAELRALIGHCRARGIRLVSDEIYHGIVYGPRAHSSLEFDAGSIVINSFSKYFCMTGWRLGWMVLPDDLVRPVERLSQNFFISPPTLSQHAAVAAFDCKGELDARVRAYADSRALLTAELPKAGFAELAPVDGAFYVYADIGALSNDAGRYCRELLADTGIAITPGTDFDPAGGNRHVRFSFAGDPAEIAEAARRLVARRGGR
ncbi:MAG: aminotransferase class I/II-fold pyridoxal phosphate-dependent enzyme [Alphaproteobacteria bacterium]|nr:aminotransferase class I/II-fold pyridoxal phosphate-dependent enzyme [Alphaproteobacteria bacterium]